MLATPFGRVPVGDSSAGLCGGMIFASLDYWHADTLPPTVRPGHGEPAFAYIVDRLIDSWHLPAGAVQYYQWMNLPDGDRGFNAFGRHIIIERGVAFRTIKVQWPQIVTDLDRGFPVALGVVTTASANPLNLGLNHQVLAYGYERADKHVIVRVYDPNSGQLDNVFIDFDTTRPTRPTTFAHNLAVEHPIRGFFRTAYAPVKPPPTG